MSSTYISLHYHIVFSTKNCEAFIDAELRPQLHGYMGGILHRLEAQPQGIGGTIDHVHLLVGLKATHCLANVMRELKKVSSLYVNEKRPGFSWQEGYAAFTVSAPAKGAVRRYIANQEKHHRVKSFREELIEMLKQAEVEYDPRYLD